MITASASTSQKSAIFSFISGGMKRSAAAQQDVGLDTDGAQFLDAVLGRLGLQFLRGGDPGHQRDVHEDAVFAALLRGASGGWLRGTAAIRYRRRCRRFRTITTSTSLDTLRIAGLNFVGDVGDHLHGLAEVIAAALALDDLLVDAAGGQIIGAGEVAWVKRS